MRIEVRTTLLNTYPPKSIATVLKARCEELQENAQLNAVEEIAGPVPEIPLEYDLTFGTAVASCAVFVLPPAPLCLCTKCRRKGLSHGNIGRSCWAGVFVSGLNRSSFGIFAGVWGWLARRSSGGPPPWRRG